MKRTIKGAGIVAASVDGIVTLAFAVDTEKTRRGSIEMKEEF